METKPLAFLIEEFDINGLLVWKTLSFFEPNSVEYLKDIKGKKHNLKVTQLIGGKVKNVIGVAKYDSNKFVFGD
jgi:hypothetical protein